MTALPPSEVRNEGSAGRRFHLKQLIGAGAFGEVYLADMVSSGGFRRRVAVKLLHADVAKHAGAAMRMRDEARILGHLAHRHVVGVLDLVRLGERWAVVMDFVPGADLEQVINYCLEHDLSMPIPAVLEVGAAVCSALDAAWQADDGEGNPLRVVHRDIKPSNLRLTADGDLKVLDFGVARVELAEREAATRGAGWIGTERYMAPERILMDGDTPAGDVYATAASLVELILLDPLGRTPVLAERHAPWLEAALARVREKLPANETTDALIDTLRESLHADPQQRPTAGELSVRMDSLARAAQGETLRAFSQRVVGELVRDASHAPAEGVLSEHLTSYETLAPKGVVKALTTDAFMDEASEPTPPPPSVPVPPQTEHGPARWIIAGFGALVLLALVGGAAVGLGGLVYYGALGPGQTAPLTADVIAAPPTPIITPAPVAIAQPVAPEPALPVPEALPEPAAVVPAPAPVIAAAPRPAPAVPKAAPVISPDAPRVRSAKFVATDVSSLSVLCGDKRASGTASALIRDLPAGNCKVSVTYLGAALNTDVSVTRPAEVHCAVTGGSLKCDAQ